MCKCKLVADGSCWFRRERVAIIRLCPSLLLLTDLTWLTRAAVSESQKGGFRELHTGRLNQLWLTQMFPEVKRGNSLLFVVSSALPMFLQQAQRLHWVALLPLEMRAHHDLKDQFEIMA